MPADLTEEELARLEALEAAATPGEWRAGTVDTDCIFVPSTHPDRISFEHVVLRMNKHFDTHEADARLIAAMRNALPALLASARTVQRLEALRVRLENHAFHVATDYERGASNVARLALEALTATAGTDADRTDVDVSVIPSGEIINEPPRPEARERRCEHCNMREHAYPKGGRCLIVLSGRHSFDEPTEELKPEPQPSGHLVTIAKVAESLPVEECPELDRLITSRHGKARPLTRREPQHDRMARLVALLRECAADPSLRAYNPDLARRIEEALRPELRK